MVKTGGKQFTRQNSVVKKMRSGGYPLLSLPRAIAAAKKIYDNLGQGPHSRQNLARGLGYASFSGAVSGKIGALVHFGLLSRLSGLYSVTLPARAIFLYPEKNCVAEIFAAAKADEAVAKYLDGQDLVKEIYVPGRLVNLVVKPA